MYCIIVLLSVGLQTVAIHGAVNYCGARMCGHSDGHTFCKYRPGPSPSCTGYIEAKLSAEEKTHVLARLNRRRSEVAFGWRHWPPAGDMLKLRWIEELSREAQRWADQCRPPSSVEERDACRDLYSISVGQCVASIVGEAPGLRPETMVDMWFMQSMLYDGNITSYIPKNDYGDFAQMMWSRTYLVGCGRSRFMAEWRGRLRSVERLVCNFAPRGPVPARPLWTPAYAASICPSRSNPDKLPGLCTYQHDVNESRSINDSGLVQDNYLLATVLEIEKNQSLDYLGSLDELYLTKIAIATIGTDMPMMPLYYSLQKRDVFKRNEIDNELLTESNASEITYNISTRDLISKEKPILKPKPVKSKVKIIGRPKPYDINELNDAVKDQKFKNLNDIQEVKKNNEKDLYAEYGLVETEEDDIVDTTTAVGVLVQPIQNDNTTEVILEKHGIIEVMNTTDGIVPSRNYYFKSGHKEVNDVLMNNKSIDDYLSDPETVRALQDALEQMERTLATPKPVSTSGKVRRELRNLESDLQNATGNEMRPAAAAAGALRPYETMKEEERNRSKDRGPMLSMVLKYMPYLKAYENTIVGDTSSNGDAMCYDVTIIICSVLLRDLVL